MSNLSASSTVVIRYANALMDLATESKAVDKVLKDLGEIAKMIDSSADLAAMISSPMIEKSQQQDALFAIAKKAKFQDLTTNFFGVLVQNGRLNALPVIVKAFMIEYAKRQGQVSATVTAAQKLSAAQEKELQKSLSKVAGSDVVLDIQIDPDILGGLIVKIGSTMIDNSVSRKLVRLKSAMSKSGANENTPKKSKSKKISEVS